MDGSKESLSEAAKSQGQTEATKLSKTSSGGTRKVAQTYAQAGPYLSAGTQFAASIILCMFAGWWLDGKVGTTPWLLIAGVFLGALSGFYTMYKSLVSDRTDKKEDEVGSDADELHPQESD